MYTEGNLDPNPDHDNARLYEQRALELRLNVISIYFRCAHFTFSTRSLQAWSVIAVLDVDVLYMLVVVIRTLIWKRGRGLLAIFVLTSSEDLLLEKRIPSTCPKNQSIQTRRMMIY
jgi:hypothetical protein